MKINEITIGRKFNLGNYESMEIRISAEPEEKDTLSLTLDKNSTDWKMMIETMGKQLDEKIKELKEELSKKEYPNVKTV